MKVKLRYLFFVVVGFLVTSCQLKPTTVIEESADVFANRTVLMDTRSALDYASFHIKGSANLLVDDFIMRKNQKRVFDPDLNSVIERLAYRGINPNKKVLLIGYRADSVENKKWKWLLNNLEITDVTMHSFDEFRKNASGRFASAKPVDGWMLKSSENVQKEFLLRKVQRCFVTPYIKQSWPEAFCN